MVSYSWVWSLSSSSSTGPSDRLTTLRLYVHKHYITIFFQVQVTCLAVSFLDILLPNAAKGDSALRDIFCRTLGAIEPVRVIFAPNISRTKRLPLAKNRHKIIQNTIF